MKRLYEEDARAFVLALYALASNPEALENAENYLSIHFAEWMTRFNTDPADLVAELEIFARM